ncbi:MAG: thiamine phosphate synthase [Lachnospiraceae bacterium]|nr:thiamine phosphate synthase [Lachnospiraceae bacterium]
MTPNDLILYAITDRSFLHKKPLEEAVREAILGGATIVQLREKSLKGDELKALAIKVKEVCNWYNVPFIINDDVILAKEIQADGVHVGQSDMAVSQARSILGSDKIVGATAKTLEQAKEAELAGADYLGSGAVFGTTTKADAKPMSLELFTDICNHVDIPVVAIGGINIDNVENLKGTPLAGACFVSGIFGASDITKTTGQIKDKLLTFIS